jgi:hypothetical protein
MTASSLTRTNCGPSLEARCALRGHTVSNRQLTLLRRTTSEMFTFRMGALGQDSCLLRIAPSRPAPPRDHLNALIRFRISLV